MELCFNEVTVMKNGTLPEEDIALCAQAGFSAVELRKGTLLRYLPRRRDAGGAAANAGGAARPRGESGSRA